VGNITVPDPTLIVITPWDKGIIPSIEKAIQQANLNLSPVVDGNVVRVPVPPLTQERREELVKLLHQKSESGRVQLRNLRTELKKQIEAQKNQAGVSEDEVEQHLKELDELNKEFMEQIDQLTKQKEQELMSL
jgi:ribosome recycling factor